MRAVVSILLLCLPALPVKSQPAGGEPNKGSHRFTNELAGETSPYLLQHAHNPVNWYPWGERPLQKAKAENKLLLISIGYAACHWCHVMERETFSDTAVARFMNEHFVSIRVDREERPDVDAVYGEAAERTSGNTGWPLHAIALSDGTPVYGGTYFTPKDWLRLLEHYSTRYRKNPAALRKLGARTSGGIRQAGRLPVRQEGTVVTLQDLHQAFAGWKPLLDRQQGGSKKVPKFPMPALWDFLLYYHYLTGNGEALHAVKLTLNQMAAGGIYDQLGGGFARYATGAAWRVPHFEKMLYDNAQLVSLYARAYQATKAPVYRQVVYETLDFIARDMTSPEGGFYASIDAESEGEEGRYYVWTRREVEKALGADARLFCEYYHISEEGNWSGGKNILYRDTADVAIAARYRMNATQLLSALASAKKRLLAYRQERTPPRTDDKILTSWNALMLKGLVQAYRAFGEERFLQAALRNARFLQQKAIGPGHQLTRNYKDGRATIPGFLDDYAFTISAFIDLYGATFEEQWLHEARKLTGYVQQHFSDTASGMFYYAAAGGAGLIARNQEIADHVYPSSNSEMARNLFYLGHYFGDDAQVQQATRMLARVRMPLRRTLPYYANWALLGAAAAGGIYEVAIVGPAAGARRQELDRPYLPNAIMTGGEQEGGLELLAGKLVPGQTIIYVCRNKACRQPVTTADSAIRQIIPAARSK